MNTWNILLVDGNEEQMKRSVQLLQGEPTWTVTTATHVEDAINVLYRQPVDILVPGNNIDETDERKLRKVAAYQQPELLIVAGTGDDMINNISHAIGLLETGKRPEIRFMDDALKNAGIPVVVQ